MLAARCILVRVAVLPEPQPQELFVKIFRLLSRCETRCVGVELPIPRRIRRMDFIDEHEAAILIGSEFVFGIDQYKSIARRQFLPAREERKRRRL